MDKFNRAKTNGTVVFLADYTVKAFKNAGISLEEIAVLGNQYYTDEAREFGTWRQNNDQFQLLEKKIKNRMAISDVAEIETINDFLFKKIFNFNYQRDELPRGTTDFVRDLSLFTKWESAVGYDKQVIIADFVNLYKDLEKDTSSILVSENNEEKFYTFETYENTVFVILHEGFANLTIGTPTYNKQAKQFSVILMDYMFKRLGEDVTLKSSLLRPFMNLHC